ncbi:MAG: hypothetical protein RBU29_13975 [bacterium]|jgi:hypothetical protein|nr:hypothetical protein [bacterium]
MINQRQFILKKWSWFLGLAGVPMIVAFFAYAQPVTHNSNPYLIRELWTEKGCDVFDCILYEEGIVVVSEGNCKNGNPQTCLAAPSFFIPGMTNVHVCRLVSRAKQGQNYSPCEGTVLWGILAHPFEYAEGLASYTFLEDMFPYNCSEPGETMRPCNIEIDNATAFQG